MNSTSELDATYHGFIGSTYDALILFEACIAGQIKHVPRRPHDLERERVIKSGSIFIYEENASGIRRWTDGISWSPSRILGNFLIYRQLVKAFGPGEKKKAIKKSKPGPNGTVKNRSNISNSSRNKENLLYAVSNLQATGGTYGRAGTIKLETEKALIGSLTDSYDFLEDGLVKKTISVSYGDVTHHLVSYYTISDVIIQKFIVPSKDPMLAGIYPRVSLLSSQNFRSAIEDIDPIDRPTRPQHTYEMNKEHFSQHQIPIISAPESFSSNGETAKKLHNSHYDVPAASKAHEHGLPARTSMFGYTDRHDTPFGSYTELPRPDHCQGDYKQNFAVAGRSSLEGVHTSMPVAEEQQRDIPFFQGKDSEDPGVSIFGDKTDNNSTFNYNQKSFYGFPQGSILTINSLTAQQTLLGPLQAGFSGQAAYEGFLMNRQKHPVAVSLENTEMWLLGNASVGHAHYQDV